MDTLYISLFWKLEQYQDLKRSTMTQFWNSILLFLKSDVGNKVVGEEKKHWFERIPISSPKHFEYVKRFGWQHFTLIGQKMPIYVLLIKDTLTSKISWGENWAKIPWGRTRCYSWPWFVISKSKTLLA